MQRTHRKNANVKMKVASGMMFLQTKEQQNGQQTTKK